MRCCCGLRFVPDWQRAGTKLLHSGPVAIIICPVSTVCWAEWNLFHTGLKRLLSGHTSGFVKLRMAVAVPEISG